MKNNSQTVWKFSTLVNNRFESKFVLNMPLNVEILYVNLDTNNFPCIWALVYPENSLEERTFELFATGEEIVNDMGIERKYIGSYCYQNGEFIGHIFERIN